MENLGKPGATFQSDRERHVIYDLHHKKYSQERSGSYKLNGLVIMKI